MGFCPGAMQHRHATCGALQTHLSCSTPPTLGVLTCGEQSAYDASLAPHEHIRAVHAGVWGMARSTRAESRPGFSAGAHGGVAPRPRPRPGRSRGLGCWDEIFSSSQCWDAIILECG